jgi:hypothetical protein
MLVRLTVALTSSCLSEELPGCRNRAGVQQFVVFDLELLRDAVDANNVGLYFRRDNRIRAD